MHAILTRLRAMPRRQRLGTLLITVLPTLSLAGGLVSMFATFALAPVTWNDGFMSGLRKGDGCYRLAFVDTREWRSASDSKSTQGLLQILAGLYCTARLLAALEWLWPLGAASLLAGVIVLLTTPRRPATPSSGLVSGEG